MPLAGLDSGCNRFFRSSLHFDYVDDCVDWECDQED